MHEVGIMIEVIRNVENFARINRLTKIDTLVLQIGELSSVIPRYIEACYPAAVDGTLLQDTKLKIEILPGNAICKKCNKVFNLIENNNKCPNCVSKDWEILCGKEFMIKEIVAC
ncbi:hydrogenase maturation nickel metallochaperone HypA [Clostridium sporogenes]|uniref:hydrogenase maturation nickel metallochaperone HypA/HybF n=1 Tax=Clostridium TaxID=1485 RepID=UPI0006ABB085|nr:MULTISPECIES: hydrogenase maturation nickel metallochaperone HypA [Clostridium]KOR24860.1 hydrogenase nickel incorporation protein HypA [Clostridium sp. L74]NFV14071.1 hydrogenase maturation nickel metallochaperone HypA [Clostridium sporogenes]